MRNFEIKQAIMEERIEFFNENIKPVIQGMVIGAILIIGYSIVSAIKESK